MTKLKEKRLERGFTQHELSIRSDVKLRTIQEYEQGRKDINKAESLTVYKLSKGLGCRMEELLEI